jgi:hypothetical protein
MPIEKAQLRKGANTILLNLLVESKIRLQVFPSLELIQSFPLTPSGEVQVVHSLILGKVLGKRLEVCGPVAAVGGEYAQEQHPAEHPEFIGPLGQALPDEDGQVAQLHLLLLEQV